MSLTDAEYTRLQALLQGLDGERLYPSAQSFVQDQIERERQYGQDIRLSPKQRKWLEDLYEEKVGQLDGTRLDAGGVPDDGRRMARPMSTREVDDDIPF